MKDQDEQGGSGENFCLNDFRKWMEEHAAEPFNLKKEAVVGAEVEPRLSPRRTARRMEAYAGDVREMTREFCRRGGVVREVHGAHLMIEVSKGTFFIPRGCVRRKGF